MSPLADEHGVSESGKRRYKRIYTALAAALLGKGSSVLMNLIAVPVLVRCLGPEEYGLWITISTMAGMLIILDVGLASTLTNLISEAFARDDKEAAAHYFATAFWSMLCIVSTAGLVMRLAWKYISWDSLFHIQNPNLQGPLSTAVAAAITVFLFGLVVALGARVMGGYQEVHIVNIFNTICSLVSLVALLWLATHKAPLQWFVVCSIGAPVAANTLAVIWILLRKPWLTLNPRMVRRNVIRRIFHSGSQFFLIQVAGLVVFNSDNLVISHFLSPAQVTPYTLTWRITGYVVVVQTLMNPALWPAYSEAWARGDVAWMRKAYARVQWTTLLSLGVGSAILIPFGRKIIEIWAGPAAVPSEMLVCLMCVWVTLLTMSGNQAIVIGAASRTRIQAISSILAAAMNLFLTIWWVQKWGVIGVLLATITSYVLFVNIVQSFVVRSVLGGVGAPRSGQVVVHGVSGENVG